MKKIHFLLTLLLLTSGCDIDFDPNPELLLYERIDTKGMVMLSDVFEETNMVPAEGAIVFLAGNKTATPFFNKDTADQEGRFTFSYKPQNKDGLYVVGRYTDGTGLAYEGSAGMPNTSAQSGSDNIISLNPLYPGGTLKVVVQGDDPDKQPVNGVDVYLYTNQDQAKSISDVEPTGFTRRKVTNEKGIAFFHDLKSGDYFILAKLGKRITDQKKDNVLATLAQADKLAKASVVLVLPSSASNGRLMVVLKDQQTSEPLAKVDVHLFASQVQAETIYNDNGPRGDIEKTSTSARGEALFQNLAAGDYYVAIFADFSDTRKLRKVAGPVMVHINQIQPDRLSVSIP